MSYNIRHIRLFEARGFGKISKNKLQDKSSSLDNLNKSILSNKLSNDFNQIITDILQDNENYIKYLKIYYDKLGVRYKPIRNDIPDINYPIHISILHIFEDNEKIDVIVKTNESCVYVNIPCYMNFDSFSELFFGKNSLQSPYDMFNGMLEYYFNNNKMCKEILQKYNYENFIIKVKFKIAESSDKLLLPRLVFFDYDDTTYIDDFNNKFLNMFYNKELLINTALNKRGIIDAGIYVDFINSFINSKDFKEVTAIDNLINGTVKIINLYYIYSVDFYSMSSIYRTYAKYYSNYKPTSGPACTSIASSIIDLIKQNKINEFNVCLRFGRNTMFLARNNISYLTTHGFNNKFVDFVDDMLKSDNMNMYKRYKKEISNINFFHDSNANDKHDETPNMFDISRKEPINPYIYEIDFSNNDNSVENIYTKIKFLKLY